MLPDEFPELAKVHDGFMPDPKQSVALIAIDAGKYVGRIFLVSPAHVEGPWVDEEYRGRGLFQKLVARAEEEAKKAGIHSLFAYGADDYMESLIRRLGYTKQRLTVWKKEL